jgi:hypothetical protein
VRSLLGAPSNFASDTRRRGPDANDFQDNRMMQLTAYADRLSVRQAK